MGAGAVISNQSGVTGGQGRLYNKNSWRNEFKKCESLSHTRRMSLNNFEWELTDIKSPIEDPAGEHITQLLCIINNSRLRS